MKSALRRPAPPLVLATGNPGKARELIALLEGVPFELRTLADYPGLVMPEETGATYEANALLKACATARHTGVLSLGDDSGLEVDALGGAPGIRSARFGGPGLDDEGRIRHLLALLEAVPDAARTARFRCVIAIVAPDGHVRTVEGASEGRITRERRGAGGFGYDPVFFYPPLGRTFGELGDEAKAAVSHRGRAAAAARAVLDTMV